MQNNYKYTHNLSPLQAGDIIAIQSLLIHRWNITGKTITVLPDRQYRIRVDGSRRIRLRNCRFLRKWEIKAAPTPIPSATPVPITSTSNAPLLHPNHPIGVQWHSRSNWTLQTSHIYITTASVIKNSSSSVQVITI